MTYTIIRDCPVTAIPSGTEGTLTTGMSVFVTQTLGGNVTVRTDQGLFRIAKENVGALSGYSPEAPDASAASVEFSETAVWDALRSCFDPEIPVNIVDLGLVYDLDIEQLANGLHRVEVKMTLTAQGCGMGPVIAEDARGKIAALPAVEEAKVHIVWDPIWSPHMISEAGRLKLGLE
ncbi:MAG: iron-sulfur cluster assembly protein [Cephaloticoccus sp.]|nr:iron-sulfur cluster assembly protein [Cephaloticoccus sp.]MCF7760028.1 iron-sulfur cluster assembly protein [Cephaloticoccus sp.]